MVYDHSPLEQYIKLMSSGKKEGGSDMWLYNKKKSQLKYVENCLVHI